MVVTSSKQVSVVHHFDIFYLCGKTTFNSLEINMFKKNIIAM